MKIFGISIAVFLKPKPDRHPHLHECKCGEIYECIDCASATCCRWCEKRKKGEIE